MSSTAHNARRRKQITVSFTEGEAAFLDVLAHRMGVSRPSLLRAFAYNGVLRHLLDIDDPMEPVVAVTARGARFGVPKRSAVKSAHRTLRKHGLERAVLDAIAGVNELPMPELDPPNTQTAAQSCFDRGRRLMASGRRTHQGKPTILEQSQAKNEQRLGAIKQQVEESLERRRHEHNQWRLRTAREEDVQREPERLRREKFLGRPVEPWWPTEEVVLEQIRSDKPG